MSLMSRSNFSTCAFSIAWSARVREGDPVAAALEEHLHADAGIVMIIHHEEMPFAIRPLRLLFVWQGSRRGYSVVRPSGAGTVFSITLKVVPWPRPALSTAMRAAVRPHHRFGNREPEPEAAEFSRDRALALLESVENLVRSLRGRFRCRCRSSGSRSGHRSGSKSRQRSGRRSE